MKKNFIKGTIFIILGIIMWEGVLNVTSEPNTSGWDNEAFTRIYNNRNSYDVLCLGTSMAVTNISSEELFLNYNITMTTLGSPEQPIYLSYYYLEEALKYQSPKIVLFDVQSLFYTEENIEQRIQENEYQYVHFLLDNMKMGKVKKKVIEEVKNIDPDIDKWDYYSKMYNSHSNWENISVDNFKKPENDALMNGNLMLFRFDENSNRTVDVFEVENTDKIEEINNYNMLYLKKMVDLCDQKEVKLVFVRGQRQVDWSWDKYNTIERVASEYGVDSMDINLVEYEIGFDSRFDSDDGTHLNVLGAKKWTDFLGEYLSKNIIHTSETGIEKKYEKEKEKYNNILEFMEIKKKLCQSYTFAKYIDTLCEIKNKEVAIMISVNDDAFSTISDQDISRLKKLGLSADFKNKEKNSYAALIEGNNLCEKLDEQGVEISGNLDDNTKIEIKSGGGISKYIASIMINEKETLSGGKGINIVVYDKKCSKVLSSVYFDTCLQENSLTYKIDEYGIKKMEVAENEWENVR